MWPSRMYFLIFHSIVVKLKLDVEICPPPPRCVLGFQVGYVFGKGGSTIAEVKAKAGVTIRTEVRCKVKEGWCQETCLEKRE